MRCLFPTNKKHFCHTLDVRVMAKEEERQQLPATAVIIVSTLSLLLR